MMNVDEYYSIISTSTPIYEENDVSDKWKANLTSCTDFYDEIELEWDIHIPFAMLRSLLHA